MLAMQSFRADLSGSNIAATATLDYVSPDRLRMVDQLGLGMPGGGNSGDGNSKPHDTITIGDQTYFGVPGRSGWYWKASAPPNAALLPVIAPLRGACAATTVTSKGSGAYSFAAPPEYGLPSGTGQGSVSGGRIASLAVRYSLSGHDYNLTHCVRLRRRVDRKLRRRVGRGGRRLVHRDRLFDRGSAGHRR